MLRFAHIGNFSEIKNIHQLSGIINEKPEIKSVDSGYDTVSISYAYFNKATFSDAISEECRGTVFCRKTGALIARPLHKFFNVGERESLSELDLNDVLAVWEKLDGAMINSVIMNDKVLLKTKNSFFSESARKANLFIGKNKNYHDFCLAIGQDYTVIFEYLDPYKVEVVNQKVEKLVFLHLRHNESGDYVPFNDPVLENLISEYQIERCMPVSFINSNGKFDKSSLMRYIENERETEGVVIQFNDGKMVKCKTKWYQNNSINSGERLRYRDVVRLVCEGKIDDKKSELSLNGFDLTELEKIEDEIIGKIKKQENKIKTETEIMSKLSSDEQKERIRTVLKSEPLLGCIMSELKGKPVDLLLRFMNSELKNYSLLMIELKKKK